MENLSITVIWRLLTWLPNYFLRKIFTKDRLADLVIIDVRPRHDYCTINLGSSASFDLWLQIINLSPFDIEIDRAELKLHCTGTTHKSMILEKRKICAGEIAELYFSENIGDGQANQIAQNPDNDQTSIEMVVEFNCTLHDFKKLTGRLEGVRPRFLNRNARDT